MFNEAQVELAALDWLQQLGYDNRFGPEIAPGAAGAERESYADIILKSRLRSALQRLAVRDDVGFFQAVRAVLAKGIVEERRSPETIDHAIRQIISRAVASDGMRRAGRQG